MARQARATGKAGSAILAPGRIFIENSGHTIRDSALVTSAPADGSLRHRRQFVDSAIPGHKVAAIAGAIAPLN
jgi:hypothetical protein